MVSEEYLTIGSKIISVIEKSMFNFLQLFKIYNRKCYLWCPTGIYIGAVTFYTIYEWYLLYIESS